MIRSKKLALASFLAIFLIGLVSGVITERLVFDKKQIGRPPADPHDFLFQKFTTELALDETQKTELKNLLDDIRAKHHQIRRDDRIKYKTIQEEFDRDFRKILTETQLAKYDQLVQDFKEKRTRDREGRRREAN